MGERAELVQVYRFSSHDDALLVLVFARRAGGDVSPVRVAGPVAAAAILVLVLVLALLLDARPPPRVLHVLRGAALGAARLPAHAPGSAGGHRGRAPPGGKEPAAPPRCGSGQRVLVFKLRLELLRRWAPSSLARPRSARNGHVDRRLQVPVRAVAARSIEPPGNALRRADDHGEILFGIPCAGAAGRGRSKRWLGTVESRLGTMVTQGHVRDRVCP